MQTKTGHVSDLLTSRQRRDWSELNSKIRAIEPGGLLIAECPSGFSISQFRSTVMTQGRRIHKGEWRLMVRTEGRKLNLFLGPR